jgi:hypothetical protein
VEFLRGGAGVNAEKSQEATPPGREAHTAAGNAAEAAFPDAMV